VILSQVSLLQTKYIFDLNFAANDEQSGDLTSSTTLKKILEFRGLFSDADMPRESADASGSDQRQQNATYRQAGVPPPVVDDAQTTIKQLIAPDSGFTVNHCDQQETSEQLSIVACLLYTECSESRGSSGSSLEPIANSALRLWQLSRHTGHISDCIDLSLLKHDRTAASSLSRCAISSNGLHIVACGVSTQQSAHPIILLWSKNTAKNKWSKEPEILEAHDEGSIEKLEASHLCFCEHDDSYLVVACGVSVGGTASSATEPLHSKLCLWNVQGTRVSMKLSSDVAAAAATASTGSASADVVKRGTLKKLGGVEGQIPAGWSHLWPYVFVAISSSDEGIRIACCGEGHQIHLWSQDSNVGDRTTLSNSLAPMIQDEDESLDAFLDDLARSPTENFVIAVNGLVPATLAGHKQKINSVQISRSGGFLLSCSDDGTVRFWTTDGDAIFTLKGHNSPVVSCCFSSMESKVLSGRPTMGLSASASEVVVWDLDRGEPLRVLHKAFGSEIRMCAFNPLKNDAEVLLCRNNGTIGTYNIQSGMQTNLLKANEGPISHFQLSNSAGQIVSNTRHSLRVWKNEDGETVCTTPLERREDYVVPMTSVTFSHSGQLVALGDSAGMVQVWRFDTSVPCGKWILITDNTDNGATHSSRHYSAVMGCAFSGESYDPSANADKTVVATCSVDATIRLWKLSISRLNDKSHLVADKILEGHAGCVRSVILIGSKGFRAVSISDDSTIRVWNALNGRCLKSYRDAHIPCTLALRRGRLADAMLQAFYDCKALMPDMDEEQSQGNDYGMIDPKISVYKSKLSVWTPKEGDRVVVDLYGNSYEGEIRGLNDGGFSVYCPEMNDSSFYFGSIQSAVDRDCIREPVDSRPERAEFRFEVSAVVKTLLSLETREEVVSEVNRTKVERAETGEPWYNNLLEKGETTDAERRLTNDTQAMTKLKRAFTRYIIPELNKQIAALGLNQYLQLTGARYKGQNTIHTKSRKMQRCREDVWSVTPKHDDQAGPEDDGMKVCFLVKAKNYNGSSLDGQNERITMSSQSQFNILFKKLEALIADDLRQILVGFESGAIRLWDLPNMASDPEKACAIVMQGHVGKVYDATFASDDSFVGSCGADGNIRVWNLKCKDESLVQSRVLKRHKSIVCESVEGEVIIHRKIRLAPNATRALTMADDGHLRVWETSTFDQNEGDGNVPVNKSCEQELRAYGLRAFGPKVHNLATPANITLDASSRMIAFGHGSSLEFLHDSGGWWLHDGAPSPSGAMLSIEADLQELKCGVLLTVRAAPGRLSALRVFL
jgi:WD40 repeat protein